MAGDELAHELEYSKPGSPPALVLHDGQVFCFDELATGAQPFEGVERRKLYKLEPVLDASNGEWVPALVPEDQAEAVREAAAQRIAELDRMNLTLAGVVDDLKKQRAEHEAATVTAQKVFAAQREELRAAQAKVLELEKPRAEIDHESRAELKVKLERERCAAIANDAAIVLRARGKSEGLDVAMAIRGKIEAGQ